MLQPFRSRNKTSRMIFLIASVLILLTLSPQANAAIRHGASGPPPGRYACYQYGFNFTSFWTGVTIDILGSNRYTTEKAHFVGRYRFVPKGGKIVYLSGKLKGLKSWYSADRSGKAIRIVFKDGKARNTAVCGMIKSK